MKTLPRSLALLLLCALAAPSATAQGPAAARPAVAATPAEKAERDARIARADRARIRGPQNGIWIVVISDFQCPFCKKWHDEVAPLIERDYIRTGKAQIAYINYPIASLHPNSFATHEVAMCAAEQDRFFPVAEALFKNQDEWKSVRDIKAYLDAMVRTLPIDRTRLQACLASGEMRALIEADMERSKRMHVGSTPTFLIGGKPVIGAQPYEAFKAAIEAALAAAAAGPRRAP